MTAVIIEHGRCVACSQHLEMREGTWKHLHTTRDWDWRCTARKGYKGHIDEYDLGDMTDAEINELGFYAVATGVYTMPFHR